MSTQNRFQLIIVGDEILSGKRQDKHLSKCIELLAARGLQLEGAEYVGDHRARITDALKRAFSSGNIVLCTGGIGATPDDHTRQCAAAALGVELALHPQAAQLILERMQDVAREQGLPYEPERADNQHRLNMGVFPLGAEIIPNPYNKIAGFTCRSSASAVHFFPGFPVMAWPMMEWVLDTQYPHLHQTNANPEISIIVFGAMEATLTPLMEQIEAKHQGIKVFSLPSVDHPTLGKHIDLGVKGDATKLEAAYADLLTGLKAFNVKLGQEIRR